VNDTQRPHRRFAGFEILADLGADRGTHRYRALQLAMKRTVVLNVLPADSAKNASRSAFFERLLDVCAALRHENVVGAIEAGEFQGERYFVTEDVAGHTLRDAIAAEGPWEVVRALKVGRDVARALVHLESLRLVHREISPRTIMLAEGGVARLVDFRRAKFLAPDGAETWSDTSVNTALYMAPEVARGGKGVDQRADVYSLGCVLYHLVTGRPPFYGKNVAVVLDMLRNKKPRDPRWLREDLSKNVVRVLDRCLRKIPSERYAKAADLVADLDLVVAGRAPSGVSPPGSAWERPFESK
jgi:serine/threonine protein kinase